MVVSIDNATNIAWKRGIASYERSLLKKDVSQILDSTGPQDIVTYVEHIQRTQRNSKYRRGFLDPISACTARMQRFSSAIDMMAQGSPQPACLIWGSIKFALVIVHDHAEEYEKLLEALVLLGECLPRVELYTETFHESSLVQASVLAFYTSILRFWERAIKFYKRRKLWNFMRSAWNDYALEFKNLEDEMRRHQRDVEKAANAQNIYDSKVAREDQAVVNGLLVNVAMSTRHRDIVRWLAPAEHEASYYVDDLEAARSSRYGNTCRWIFGKDEFEQWSSSKAPCKQNLLWIHAIPGAGKTVLSSYLVDSLTQSSQSMSQSPVLYFFFKNTDADKNSAVAAARSLLYQMYQRALGIHHFPADIEAEMDNSGSDRAKSFRTVWRLIHKHASHFESAEPLTIVIDALDECIDDLKSLVTSLKTLSQDTSTKVIVTSRREKYLVEMFSDTITMEMGLDDVQNDIHAFLEHKVSMSPKLRHSLVRSSVIGTLSRESRGMFLWAALMIKELKSKSSVFEIQDTLKSPPDGLQAIYEGILRRLYQGLEKSPRELCRRILKWVLYATRPLRITEIHEVLSLEYSSGVDLFDNSQSLLFSERDIELVCGTLVTVRHGSVQLIHLSAKEFLQSFDESQSNASLRHLLVDASKAQKDLSKYCIDYLQSHCHRGKLPIDGSRRWTQDAQELRKSAFLEYASFNWITHLASSAHGSLVEAVRSVIPFLHSQASVVWLEFCLVLDADGLDRLQLSLYGLLDWATSYKEDKKPPADIPQEVDLLQAWVRAILQILLEYGPALRQCPSELYFINPVRIFKSSGFEPSWTSSPLVPYDQHVVLKNFGGYEKQIVSETRQLQIKFEPLDGLGFFYHVKGCNALISTSNWTDVPDRFPRIYCQECPTGRTLPPLSDVEFETHPDRRYVLMGSSLSPGGKYLGLVYMWTSKGKRFETTYVAVWKIDQNINFKKRSPLWGQKLWCDVMQRLSMPGLASPIVFDGNDRVYCPSGCLYLPSLDLRPLSEPLLQHCQPRSGDRMDFTGTGQTVVYPVYRSPNSSKNAALYSDNGDLIQKIRPLETQYPELNALSASGRFLVWVWKGQCAEPDEKGGQWMIILQDLLLNRSQNLKAPFEAGASEEPTFQFFNDEKWLLGSFWFEDSTQVLRGQIRLWTSFASDAAHLVSSTTFATPLVAFHLLEEDRLLYYVISDGTWDSINLDELETGKDVKLFHRTSNIIEYKLSNDGNRLACLRLEDQTARVQIMDINDSLSLIDDVLLVVSEDLRSSNILFSPDLKILFIGTFIYDLKTNPAIPIMVWQGLPPLTLTHRRDPVRDTYAFSSCYRFIAITQNFSDAERPQMLSLTLPLEIFKFDCPQRRMRKLEISHLLPKHWVRLSADWHPERPLLALGAWIMSDTNCNSSLERPLTFECSILDAETLEICSIGRIEVRNPLDCYPLKFSECGTYVWLPTPVEGSWMWTLPKHLHGNRTSLFEHPSLISQTRRHSWNGYMFTGPEFYPNKSESRVVLSQIRGNEIQERYGIITTVPRYLYDSPAVLLLGNEQHRNLRVLFLRQDAPPELKYSNISWAECLDNAQVIPTTPDLRTIWIDPETYESYEE